MPTRLKLELSAAQTHELEQLRDQSDKPYLRERAAALLKLAAGQSGLAIARQGLLRTRWPDTVYEWVKRYRAGGAAGLRIHPGRGRKPAFPPQQPDAASACTALLHVLHQPPSAFDLGRTRWRLADVLEACRWLRLRSRPGLCQLLRRLGIRLKRARQHVHSPDLHYREKLAHIQVHLHTRVDLVFSDEFTLYRQPSLAGAYEQVGRPQPKAELGHTANHTWRFIAGLHAWTGQVTWLDAKKLSIGRLVAFYTRLTQAYPNTLIHLVADNCPMHFHPHVLAALQPQAYPWPWKLPASWSQLPPPRRSGQNLPIKLLSLPTYASWTNPIEKLWRQLRQDVLHLHAYADDGSALKERVRQFLDQLEKPDVDSVEG
ncbi:MAG: IS630 family transposase, partial [Anaerolineales bacterium]